MSFLVTSVVKLADGSKPPFPMLYSIIPIEKEVPCGGSLTLIIYEAVTADACHKFELRITPEGGETLVVKKDDIIMFRRSPGFSESFEYNYELSDIGSNYTVELVYWVQTYEVTTSPGTKIITELCVSVSVSYVFHHNVFLELLGYNRLKLNLVA